MYPEDFSDNPKQLRSIKFVPVYQMPTLTPPPSCSFV